MALSRRVMPDPDAGSGQPAPRATGAASARRRRGRGRGGLLAMVQVTPDVWITRRVDPATEAAEAERLFAAWRAWGSTVVEAERRAAIALRLEARLAVGR